MYINYIQDYTIIAVRKQKLNILIDTILDKVCEQILSNYIKNVV